METKKSQEANIEKLRFPIMLTALLFTGSIVLASFTYTSGKEREDNLKITENVAEITFMEEVKEVTPPETPPQVDEIILPPDENILIDSITKSDPPKPFIPIQPPVINIGPDVVLEKPPVIEFPDVEASFPGGAAAMQKWIAKNVHYPETSIVTNEEGKVYLSFVVEADGSLSDITIERGVSNDINNEAKRLLRNMPNWLPGEAQGKKARTRCRLPINFQLN